MRTVIHRYPWPACAKDALIISTGGLFALLCLLIFMFELIVKLIAIPVIFLFGLSVLAFGRVKIKFQHL
jgi:hypothetical protein